MWSPPVGSVSAPRSRRRHARLGKKLKKLEQEFWGLSKELRKLEVFLALCRAASIDEEKAKEHFALALALNEKGAVHGG